MRLLAFLSNPPPFHGGPAESRLHAGATHPRRRNVQGVRRVLVCPKSDTSETCCMICQRHRGPNRANNWLQCSHSRDQARSWTRVGEASICGGVKTLFVIYVLIVFASFVLSSLVSLSVSS